MSEWEAGNTFKAFSSKAGRERGKVLPGAVVMGVESFFFIQLTQVPSSHAVLKPQFPLLYYEKAQSNMADKVLLDLALSYPQEPASLSSLLPHRVLASSTSGPLHILFPLPGKLPHPLSLANSFPFRFQCKKM